MTNTISPKSNVETATVLLADDHAMVAQAIGDYLIREGFDLLQVVGDGASVIQAAKIHSPDVIVLDMSMPGLSGLDALRRLREAGVKSKVIFLTMYAEPELAGEAMRAGASGYVLKMSSGEELVSAIRQVLRGRVYLTPLIAKDVVAALASRAPGASALPASSFSAPSPSSHSGGSGHPTNRQMQVLELLVAGNTMKEIASNLGLSPRTVETHKYEMMQSLGVRTTAELVTYALRHGLIAV